MRVGNTPVTRLWAPLNNGEKIVRIYKLELPYPISVNRMYTRGRNLQPDAREYKRYVPYLIKKQCALSVKKDELLSMLLILHPKRLSGDADNRVKILQDCIVSAGIIEDDNRIYPSRQTFGKRGEKSWCELFLATIPKNLFSQSQYSIKEFINFTRNANGNVLDDEGQCQRVVPLNHENII